MRARLRRPGLLLLLGGVLLLAAGCGSPVRTRAFAVQVAPEANDRSPVPVALVVVYDPSLLETVAALTARDWFRQREQLARDFPGGFTALSWEFVPGQRVPLQPVRFRHRRARGAFVFADYAAPGDHRIRIDPYRRVTIRLLDDDLSVAPSGGR